jgi:dihydroneopterin aldolase
MDKIALYGISCEANLGLKTKERKKPELLVLDVIVGLDLEAAANEDDLSLTINYEDLVTRVRKLVDDHEFNIVESVAGHLCKALLAATPIDTVEVIVRRFPDRLQDSVESVSVEMKRR